MSVGLSVQVCFFLSFRFLQTGLKHISPCVKTVQTKQLQAPVHITKWLRPSAEHMPMRGSLWNMNNCSAFIKMIPNTHRLILEDEANWHLEASSWSWCPATAATKGNTTIGSLTSVWLIYVLSPWSILSEKWIAYFSAEVHKFSAKTLTSSVWHSLQQWRIGRSDHLHIPTPMWIFFRFKPLMLESSKIFRSLLLAWCLQVSFIIYFACTQ